MAERISIDRSSFLRALEHLEVIVPSLARIGSAAATMSEEEHRQVLAEFVWDWDVARRLAEVRRLLSEAIDYDEGEKLLGDIEGWRFNQRKPR